MTAPDRYELHLLGGLGRATRTGLRSRAARAGGGLVGESVVIGDEVEAPRHVSVHRRELLDELAETNRAAASPDQGAVAGLSRLLSNTPGVARGKPGEDDSRT